MICTTLPDGFVATRIPGYFWDVNSQKLYSIKTGVLREMILSVPNRYNGISLPAYRVSHEGKKRYITLEELVRLKPICSVVPVDKTPIAERRQQMLHKRYTKAIEQANTVHWAKRAKQLLDRGWPSDNQLPLC